MHFYVIQSKVHHHSEDLLQVLTVFACHITDKKQVHKSFDIKTELS